MWFIYAHCFLGFFPGGGNVTWRDWYTHAAVEFTPGQKKELPAPLGHINVHIRDGSAILLHGEPAYTIEETKSGPFNLLVSLDAKGTAKGRAYIDDGESNPPGPSRVFTFDMSDNQLVIISEGSYEIQQKLMDITILGVGAGTNGEIKLNGQALNSTFDAASNKLAVAGVGADLNNKLSFTFA